jgi:D-alanyl-D-alanine carboxypeptidase (penicillin-binding protein 5/6)
MDTRTAPSHEGSERAAELLARRERMRAIREAKIKARRRMVASFGSVLLVTIVALVWGLVRSGSSRPPGPTAGGPKSSTASAQYALPRLHLTLPSADPPVGHLPAMPFPAKGEGAVALMGTGTVAASRNEKEVPIASVTKVMTAYLTLLAHPLHGNQQGPTFHFTAADHRAWIVASEHGDSNVELVKGETLTERQMLEALLIPSADNVADILGRWVAGSDGRFVREMNRMAASLGMRHTHYADPSGVSPHSVSTAADQALLASIVMENPELRSLVALQTVAFPVMGHIWNYNPVLGSDGIIGVKSGFTNAAEGCLVTAAWRKVGDRRVLVISSVIGQPLGLWQAGQADIALLDAATKRLQLLSMFGSTTQVARVSVPWSHATVGASIAAPVRLAGWPGLLLSDRLVGVLVTQRNIRHGWSAGEVVAHLEVRSQFGPVASYPVSLDGAIGPPPAGSVVLRSPVPLGVVGRH